MLKAEEVLDTKEVKDALKMKAKGMTYSSIAQEFSAIKGKELSADDFKNLFLKREKAALKEIKEDETGRLSSQYFDTINQMRDLNNAMWKFFYELKEEGNIKEAVRVADHLLKQLEHVDKVLGRLQDKGLNITINKVDLSKKLAIIVPKMFEKAEKKGAIKIKNKKLIEDL